MEPKKKGMTLVAKQKAAGWAFLIPASAMIAIMSFFPMVKAFILSLQTGKGANMHLSGFSNYVRMFQDKVFLRSVEIRSSTWQFRYRSCLCLLFYLHSF